MSLLAYDKALQYVTVSDSKTQATIWISKGGAPSKAGKQSKATSAFQTAAEAIDRALQDDSNNTSHLQLKSEALFKQSKYDETLKAYDADIAAAVP